jgi:hypothetical protein
MININGDLEGVYSEKLESENRLRSGPFSRIRFVGVYLSLAPL